MEGMSLMEMVLVGTFFENKIRWQRLVLFFQKVSSKDCFQYIMDVHLLLTLNCY